MDCILYSSCCHFLSVKLLLYWQAMNHICDAQIPGHSTLSWRELNNFSASALTHDIHKISVFCHIFSTHCCSLFQTLLLRCEKHNLQYLSLLVNNYRLIHHNRSPRLSSQEEWKRHSPSDPKRHIYVPVTKPSSGHSYYDRSKEGIKVTLL